MSRQLEFDLNLVAIGRRKELFRQFAGLHESVVPVSGGAQLIDAVRIVWASPLSGLKIQRSGSTRPSTSPLHRPGTASIITRFFSGALGSRAKATPE